VDRAHERARAKLRLVTQPAFEDVLVAARRSDGEAWQELYGAYAGRVHAYLRAQGAVDAEDLTSEVFLRVYARLDTFSGDEAQFRSWLFTVAHRILIDDVRRNRRRPQPTASPAAVEHLAAGDVEAEAIGNMGREWVDSLIAALPGPQRDVLALRVVADLPLADVAVILGKRTGAVKALQHRALARLRRALGEEETR
jgi:RNA polymerase sigma-70 factor (ECF subfamily)